MHDLETLRSGGYIAAGLTQFKLTCPLATFPEEILELGDTLSGLDLSGTGLSSLPATLGSALPNLKIAYFSNCNFRAFPEALGSCPKLEIVNFRSNVMQQIPEDALPPSLRVLGLTDNRLTRLPSSIGRCSRLQKCMLAGNQLRDLPPEMAQCQKLTMLRLSSNLLEALPAWLLSLPELAFLSFASNPCASPTTNGVHTRPGLVDIPWRMLEVSRETPSNTLHGLWRMSPDFSERVAIKLFRGPITDVGCPADEMVAWLAAGAHENLMTVMGRIKGHPDEDVDPTFQGGIVTQRITSEYAPLSEYGRQDGPGPDQDGGGGGNARRLSIRTALAMLTGLANVMTFLHARGIAHGHLIKERIIASADNGHAMLADFATATIYGRGPAGEYHESIEKIEVRAFGLLLGDVLEFAKCDEADAAVERELRRLYERCMDPEVEDRSTFDYVKFRLEWTMGWRPMPAARMSDL
ncbi:leucine-rich repeat-containing protein 28 [Achaetomium macrosporum]|uniref:Leucine-rich repeat-containing protein 28 n=1 Tax=Achaetomium macrosporum TaxID=79813 RepID=A0AAN7CDJ2_9PEZI|nr:leucine-rich repeat-containing protein 28 [Achaetomium macrosporum]